MHNKLSRTFRDYKNFYSRIEEYLDETKSGHNFKKVSDRKNWHWDFLLDDAAGNSSASISCFQAVLMSS